MSENEKILISELPSDAIWRQLRLKFVEFDVEADSSDDHVYDLRESDDLCDDVVYFWGRDGWNSGSWHAKIYLERASASGNLVVYALSGGPDRVNLLAFRKKLLAFMHSCMGAREHTPPDA